MPREEMALTARPKIHAHSQIFRYGRSIYCLPHLPKISDFIDLCLHWVSVVRVPESKVHLKEVCIQIYVPPLLKFQYLNEFLISIWILFYILRQKICSKCEFPWKLKTYVESGFTGCSLFKNRLKPDFFEYWISLKY